MFEEDFLPLSPGNFFEMKISIKWIDPKGWKEAILKNKYMLPETAWLVRQGDSMPLHLGWSEEGLYGFLHLDGRFDAPSYPTLTDGDSLEIFVDTRDRKESGATTKFCHHFFFLPQAVEGTIKGECTRFRNEDSHPLVDSDELYLEAQGSARDGKLKFHIPAQALVGWNPTEFDHMGFTFRVNRRYNEPSYFSVRADEFNIEQEPSLWTSCTLKK